MGGEVSRASGVQLPQHPVEQREAFSLFRATLPTPPHDAVSVFRAEQPSTSASSLDKCAQNLMKYRHPYIMKYIWHWQQRGVHHLATEPVQSLAQVLSSQDTMQICMGLHQIVQVLDFLHDKASQSHNNICIDSIYVVSDGTWKLGNMEFLQPFTNMNSTYLKKIKTNRYTNAIDENEESIDDFTKIDQFAFATLVHDVFVGRNEDDIPHLKSFKTYCIQELQNPTASSRPKFSTLLNHEFFSQEFISIHKFLISLPVKTENEKKQFFSCLLEKLRLFDEESVAKQLAIPLLSRLVLLNSTARDKLLPYVLTPKDESCSSNSQGLFTVKTFKQHVTPHLIKMFKVRDIVVRLLLLKHFYGYMMTFDEHDLTNYILPDLLLGIKDTDDTLVSMTLYCLADLVPILGASTVISAKRCKLFTDGRPLSHQNKESINKLPNIKEDFSIKDNNSSVDFAITNNVPLTSLIVEERKLSLDSSNNTSSSNPILNSTIDENPYGSRESIELETNLFLHERPSPDGGEDLDNEIIQKPIENHLEDSDENWSDWEDNGHNANIILNEIDPSEFSNTIKESYINNTVALESVEVEPVIQSKETQNNYSKNDTVFLQKAAIDAKTKKLTDISELDIKNQKYTINKDNKSNKDEFDFFTDMEPVIEKASVLNINNTEDKTLNIVDELKNNESDQQISSKLNFIPVENDQSKVDAGAWGDVDWEED